MPDRPIIAAIEIAIIFGFFYLLLRSLKGTKGEGIFKGVILIIAIAFLALRYFSEKFELDNIQYALEQLGLPIVIFGLIVIFQSELRRVFLELGQKRIFKLLPDSGHSKIINEVVDAAVNLAGKKQGALIALEKEIGLKPYVDGGIKLDSEITKELIENIFYPGSPLHDGGVVIKDDRIIAAECLFPLTESSCIPKELGTRHRAGIGLTEESDAFVVIVSEETGRISAAIHGQFHPNLNKEELTKLINEHYRLTT